jgi:ABC-type dipeptide/oligopeptide/nickel transport system permease subunit
MSSAPQPAAERPSPHPLGGAQPSGLRKRNFAPLWLLVITAASVLLILIQPLGVHEEDRAHVLSPPAAFSSAECCGRGWHWLGTDDFGRDELSLLLAASAGSLLLAGAMAGLSILLALAAAMIGAVSRAGDLCLRIAGECSRSLPWIFVLVAVRAALPLDASRGTLALALVLLFTAGAWAIPAWVLRGTAKEIMQRDFVLAARAMGASRWHILRRHVWPHLLPPALTYFSLLYIAAVLAEVSLSLIGLGIPDLPTWGQLLLPLRDPAIAFHAWWLYSPLAIIVPLLTWMNLRAFHSAGGPQAERI